MKNPSRVAAPKSYAVLVAVGDVVAQIEGDDSAVCRDLAGKKPAIELLDGIEFRSDIVRAWVSEAVSS
jgi:hypothetical protein